MMTDDETKIVLTGGKSFLTSYTIEYSTEIFTIATNSWALAAPLPGGDEFSFVDIGNSLYAMANSQNIAFRYDAGGDVWIQIAGTVSQPVFFDSSIILVGEQSSLCG